MTRVSTSQFYLSKFGGFSGLRHCLVQDLQEIANLGDGELIRPGTYLNVYISQIWHHGFGKYSVEFASGDSYLHTEDLLESSPHMSQLLQLGVGGKIRSLSLGLARNKYSAGYLNGEYYLINPEKLVEAEFKSAQELKTYAFQNNINLKLVYLHGIQV